ncbi:hypothetical protein AXX12_01030 [Anaerosporomusa subterranea]|uniref:Chemotaxis protein n=1 Tax=Anaerosporomusa subterranea TaxID=1794912 RepID=A0A154BW46_ANASB|nr:methyl-accepting chemotaxis protein [Anaerosporomusa subterranea]KYZ78159.1 hypothetical protein AXX12_01030 [Anaerosporomusa subterranea]
MKSIRAKLTVTILIIFLLSMSALGGLNYWKARDIISENITNDIQKLSIDSAVNLGGWFEARQMELTMLASNPVIRGGNPEAIMSVLAAAKDTNRLYDGLVYADASGMSWAADGVKVSVADRAYFKHVMQGATFVSNPMVSKGTGHLVSVVAVPIKSAGNIVGILFGPMSMEEFSQKVLSIKAGQTGYAYVLQEDGLVIIHPNKEIAMKVNGLTDTQLPPGIRSVNERLVKGEKGIASYDFAGDSKYVSFAPIPGVKWSLAINVPKSEVTSAVSALTTISLVTIFVVLVITAIFIALYARRIARPIQTLEVAANRIATGDISITKLGITSNDEIGRLGQSFEQMAGNLRSLIQQVLDATGQVAASSQELTASSEQSAQAANQVTASIADVAAGASAQMEAASETTAVVEQMAANIRQIAANANQVATQSAKAADKAKDGDKAVERAVVQMGQIEGTVNSSAQVVTKLGERSKEIGQIVVTISGIAGQTNLLALNAAIEAARAGEQGRGFAVVAEEVRKLAEQSQEAAKKIAELIGEIQGDTDKAVVAMNDGTREVKSGTDVVYTAGVAFREIAGLVTEVSSQVKEISVAMQQMAAGSQQIVGSVKKIDELGKRSTGEAQSVSAAAEEQLASMEEIASSSQALAKLAEDLQTSVAGFRV